MSDDPADVKYQVQIRTKGKEPLILNTATACCERGTAEQFCSLCRHPDAVVVGITDERWIEPGGDTWVDGH